MRRTSLPAAQSAVRRSIADRAAHRPSNAATPQKLPEILPCSMRDRGVGAAVTAMTKRAGLKADPNQLEQPAAIFDQQY
ncbi:hypothetical protein NDU88_006289 [Pleurodeles waltl]|uniref:Uncharacterized protein n=1 Tax=Pleurodeles waltl TaxID=8319 RepID=A0AAV7N2L0_PLEWA|nr:hypothetical protein NDU88_006289 [Pleurodeles waltl]